MKRILYTISLLAAASAVSCADMLEVDSNSAMAPSEVFGSYSLAEGAVLGITEVMAHTNSYRARFLCYYGFNTDVEWYNSISGDANIQLAQYWTLPNNSNMNVANNPYDEIYLGIERANQAIAGLRTYGNVDSDSDMAFLLGEALTLRAMLYYDLVKAWGDVPDRFEPLSTATIYRAKASRDVIFKQILGDLEEVFEKNYLPWPNRTSRNIDRVHMAFAKGLYARIGLAASGMALRPESVEAVGTGAAGVYTVSSDPALQKSVLYPKIAQACEDVIASSGCSLYESFEQLWRDNNAFDLSVKGIGREALFVVPFGDKRGRWAYTFAGRHDNKDQYVGNSATGGRGGQVGPTPFMFWEYDKEDTRRDVTCLNYTWSKENNDDAAARQTLAGINSWYFGKYRFEWMSEYGHPYDGGNDDGFKPIVLRLADVYLMAAECYADPEGGMQDDAKARELVKPVVDRAYGSNVDAAEEHMDRLAAMGWFEGIKFERALEFCGEMLRKGDLIRWGDLKTALVAAKGKMTDLAGMKGDYAFLQQGPASYTPGTIYYKHDGETLSIWGFEREHHEDDAEPDGDYEPWTDSAGEVKPYISDSNFKAEKIESLYNETKNPTGDLIQRMFWPIFQNSLTNSQGSVRNDYGY